MELNSANIMKAQSSKHIFCDLETLSLDSMEGINNKSSRKPKRKYSNLSLNTSKVKVEDQINIEEYNLKDHYDIVETLGMGTYAYVRLATEKSTGRKVAIKTSRGNNSRELLKNEYNLLKRLADDNIIRVYDFQEDSNKKESYLIMEYFESQTIDEYVEDNGPLSEQDARTIVAQLLSSVQYMHELGIAHRDIKPENVLLNDQKEIRLIDFNISKAKTSQILREGDGKFTSVFHTQISSPLYCAPELKHSSSYTESIDIWGVGIILFTMLFGSLKSHSLNRLKTVDERTASLQDIIREKRSLSEDCKTFLISMLASSADDRPTASEAQENEWVLAETD